MSVLIVGCSNSSTPVREWKAADHAHPEQSQVDPERVPRKNQTSTQSAERAVAAVWKVSCASCHGQKGEGRSEAGFSVPALSTALGRKDSELMTSIAQGKGTMPAFSDKLGKETIAALVQHIRAFK